MYYLNLPTALLVAVTMTSKPRSDSSADGFSIPSTGPRLGNSIQSKTYLTIGASKKREGTIMLGILDDIMEEDDTDNAEQGDEDVDERQVELYHSLIFASNLPSEISRRLDDCTDPAFFEFLNASSEATQDEEERQGLADLIEQIEKVRTETVMKAADEQEKAAAAAKAKEEEEKEAEAAAASTQSAKPMSNADVLKKANQIDAAVALSDEEKPSDFISDCREVVNLSRGFNDSGQMRVGGR